MATRHPGTSSLRLSRPGDHSGYFSSPAHEEVLSRLAYLVENRRPCGLLTGPAGTGKSLLWEVFLHELRERGLQQAGLVDLRGLVAEDLPAHISACWRLGPWSDDSALQTWRAIQDHVRGLSLCRTPGVLILDHLDRADASCALGLDRLMKLAEYSHGHLTLLFAARSLEDCCAAGLVSELSDLRIELWPFDALETSRYVAYRLQASGFSGASLEPAAMMAVYRRTRGLPREINRVCDLLILTGLVRSGGTVLAEAVEDVTAELPQVPSHQDEEPALI